MDSDERWTYHDKPEHELATSLKIQNYSLNPPMSKKLNATT